MGVLHTGLMSSVESVRKPAHPVRSDGGASSQRRVIGPASAMGICVASMIGSGIFTVTGVVGANLGSVTNLMLAWGIAGIIALAGALTIAELGAMKPKASAQYVVVHESLGPVWGYLNGMINLFIGYIASIAAIALVTGGYIENLLPQVDARATATVVLISLGVAHSITVIGGKRCNDGLVIFKVLLVVAFIVAGLSVATDPLLPSAELIAAARAALPDSALATIPAGAGAVETLEHLRTAPAPPAFSAAIGLAVVTISFAYLGWETAADVAGEVQNPGRSLPLAIVGSVIIGGVIYLLMNLVYLRVMPPAAMLQVRADGTLAPMADIGAVTARHLFGDRGGQLVIGMIVLLFVSTLSVAVMLSGRVMAAMSWRGQLPTSWGALNRRGAPSVAIWLVVGSTIPMVWVSGITALFEYVGVLLTVAVCMTMISVMVQRVRFPELPRPFRIPLYPAPPIISIALGLWLIVTAAMEDWIPVAASAVTVVAILAARPLLQCDLGALDRVTPSTHPNLRDGE